MTLSTPAAVGLVALVVLLVVLVGWVGSGHRTVWSPQRGRHARRRSRSRSFTDTARRTPTPSTSQPATPRVQDPALPLAVVPPGEVEVATYLDLSRSLMAAGHPEEAILALWAHDLATLGPFLADTGEDLVRLLSSARLDEPQVMLREARRAALTLLPPAAAQQIHLADDTHLSEDRAGFGSAAAGARWALSAAEQRLREQVRALVEAGTLHALDPAEPIAADDALVVLDHARRRSALAAGSTAPDKVGVIEVSHLDRQVVP